MLLRPGAIGLSLIAAFAFGCERTPTPIPAPGGSWTSQGNARSTLIAPPPVFKSMDKLEFYTGFAFFRDPWIPAPSSTTARDGLGPLFNAHSCIACHGGGGRGATLLDSPDSPATVVRIGDEGGGQHPLFGRQLQPRAIFATDLTAKHRIAQAYFAGEGAVRALAHRRDIELGGNEIVSLREPEFEIETIPGTNDIQHVSVRVAPSLVGMGLLESIPSSRLEGLQDPEDDDGDGVSGRIHWRIQSDGMRRAGRFGWKATHATVAQQTGTAFGEDIGISNPEMPVQNCTQSQLMCLQQRHGNDPEHGVEVPASLFDSVVFFTKHIAPPPAGAATATTDRGRKLFGRLGCDGCHTPSHEVTVRQEEGGLAAETIWPYTDLLLHDMGEALSDTLPDGDAAPREWRTPPLWGLGPALAVNPKAGLLHDGRARTVTEAVLWHGGESDSSREKFVELTAAERKAVEAFVLAL